MKVFPNINELVKRLNAERALLQELFQARFKFDMTYDDALKFVDNEKNLQLLIDYGVVRREGDLVELEETYQHFFEEVLHLNEDITSSSVEENLQLLKDNIDFYLKERNDHEARNKYVRKIMRSLRNISTLASGKTIELKRVINDTYRQERNYDVKRQKLENMLGTLENIASLIRQTERLLEDRSNVLDVLTSDNRIAKLSLEVRLQFKEVFHSLIELERTIRDYLHLIDAHDKMVKRIRKLKYLKDQLTWERSTNIREVLEGCTHLQLETRQNFYTKISLPFLRDTDEGLDIIADTRKNISRLKSLRASAPAPMSAEDTDIKALIQDFVDTDVIAKAFFASSRDLFSFVMQYPYAGEQELERKVEYYTEIVLNHTDKLRISDEWETYGNIRYPLIFKQ